MKKFLFFICLFFALALPAWSQTQLPDTIWWKSTAPDYVCLTAVFSPNGNRIYYGAHNKIQIRNTVDGSLIKSFQAAIYDDIQQIAVTPDEKYIISSSNSELLKIWDAATGQLIRTYPVDSVPNLLDYRIFNSFKFSITKDGKYIIAPMALETRYSGVEGGRQLYYIYELETGKIIKRSDTNETYCSITAVSPTTGYIAIDSIAMIHDPKYKYDIPHSVNITFLDPLNFQVVDKWNYDIGITGNSLNGMFFSHDGKYLAVASDSIKIFNVESKKMIKSFVTDDWNRSVTFSYNDSLLFTSTGYEIKKWNIKNNFSLEYTYPRIHPNVELSGANSLAYHPNLPYLLAVGDGIYLLGTNQINSVLFSDSSNSFKYFPNPILDNLRIKILINIDDKIVLSINNLMGNKIKEFTNIQLNTGENLLSFDLSDLTAGTYFLNIKGKTTNFSTKIMVNK